MDTKPPEIVLTVGQLKEWLFVNNVPDTAQLIVKGLNEEGIPAEVSYLRSSYYRKKDGLYKATAEEIDVPPSPVVLIE